MTDRELKRILRQLRPDENAGQLPALDKDEKWRIMMQCNEKLSLGADARTQDGASVSGVEHLTRTRWYRPAMTAAAACLLVVCGIAGAVFLNGHSPSVQPAPPTTETPTMAETAESTAEDVTETTQIIETTESVQTAGAESTAVTESETITETTIVTVLNTEITDVTETSQEVCSVPVQTETLTFSTHTIEEPYPENVDAKRISIVYPQTNETSAETERINALIQERVQAMISYCHDAADALREDALQYGNDDLYENASCSLHVSDYEITRNDADYLSIVWHGDYYLYSAAHPNLFAQGLVIDKKTLTAVSLSDLYDVNAEFCSLVKAETAARTGAALAEKYGGTEADFADVTASIYESSLLTAGENIIDGHIFALTDSGIILDASVYHALGDYVEIHIPFETLESFRK